MAIARDRWIDNWELDCIPNDIPCVYVLYPANVVPMQRPFYVGKTDHLRARLRNHRERFGSFQFKVKFPRRYGEHLMIEARLIERIGKRLFNVQGNKHHYLRLAA